MKVWKVSGIVNNKCLGERLNELEQSGATIKEIIPFSVIPYDSIFNDSITYTWSTTPTQKSNYIVDYYTIVYTVEEEVSL